MLQVGRLGCPEATHGCPVPPGLLNWTRAHFSAFAIVSSPLVLSIVSPDCHWIVTLCLPVFLPLSSGVHPSGYAHLPAETVMKGRTSTVRTAQVPTDETLAPLLDIIGNKQAMAVNQAWAVGHLFISQILNPDSMTTDYIHPSMLCIMYSVFSHPCFHSYMIR
jgi:hypothetical protein